MTALSPNRPARSTPEQKLVGNLIALLEAGTTPWRREWDANAGGQHVNLLSGRRYRGANPVLLSLGMHLRGSALPYWCGFAEARALGIAPRRGSKAVHLLRPQVHQSPGARRLALTPASARRTSTATVTVTPPWRAGGAGSATGRCRCSTPPIWRATPWRV